MVHSFHNGSLRDCYIIKVIIKIITNHLEFVMHTYPVNTYTFGKRVLQGFLNGS